MVTPEDVILRLTLKVQIMSEIERVVTSVLNDIDTPKSEETKSLTAPSIPSNCVLNFLFPLKTFHLLQYNNILPESVQRMRRDVCYCSEKSPDQSVMPYGITSPPARTVLGTLNRMYQMS